MAKKQITNYKFTPGAIAQAYNQYPKTVALLLANRSFLIAEMDAYIRQQIIANASNSGSPFYNYVYDTTKSNKCQRDIGYLLDAVIYDLTYGGNSLTYQISANYFVSGVIQLLVPALEINVQTWLLGKITTNILTNTTYSRLNSTVTQTTITGAAAEAGGITQATTLTNISITAINSGYSSLPSPLAPNSQAGTLLPQLVSLLKENERFIQEEAIAYIAYNVANNIDPFAYFTYDQAKCRRDVSYILEGYISDLRHGGNRQSVFNAGKYFDNGVPQVDGSRLPEVAVHTFIKNLVLNFVLTNTAYTARQTTAPQVIDQEFTPEVAGLTQFVTLTAAVINTITNGLSSLPVSISNRGNVKFPGFFKLKDILLISNATRNSILYNFADPASASEVTYSNTYDSDFAGAIYGFEQITTVTFDVDTSSMMVTDNIQIFVEGKEQTVRLNSIGTDAMERARVGIPQSMLDADFEYGLQPTKWQTVSMMRNYPSVYEIPGSDQPVTSVTTDASNGTGSVGASQLTVTTNASHGFSVGDVFTIKALASSINGFSRAEGTFLVASVPGPTTFTYYAKSKVGTTNGQLLSSSYTQLRRAGFYTGASVGNPSFNVFSNGQSGTITTSLATASGSTFMGFTGTAPVFGAPLSGTGITTGTQITGVVGTGGVAAATQLTTTANINDTQLIVASTTGILTGLVFDRGDGTAVQVTSISGNTVSLSGALTSQILGTNQTYAGLTQSATSGTGSGAVFDISRLGNSYAAQIGTSAGTGYVATNTLTIAGGSLGGTSSNNATITVTLASPLASVETFNNASLVAGTGYIDAFNVATTGGTGTGLTVDLVTDGNKVLQVIVNNAGSGYTVNDTISITAGNNNATIQIAMIQAGGLIESFTISGTPITAPTNSFISALTLSDVTTSLIATGNTGVTYTSIATIEVVFTSAHGFVPGDSITTSISSSGSNAQQAAGAFYVEQVPTPTSLRYTARAPGTIANTLTGVVYSRPDSYYVHRPLDGGVQLGTGGPAHGATAIRMSKKYIRYQSGKGIMYNTGALFAPSYDIQSITSTSTSVGSTITLVTDDTDHGCQVGAIIQISGVQTSGYNGVYTVSKITNERSLSFSATQTLGATTGLLGSPCQMSVRNWHGATIRSGTFDDQNGMFWQYDGIRMALVKRSSTFQIAGTISIAANDNKITGVNSRFTQQLTAGDRIVIRGMSHVVSSITNDTTMTVTPDYRGVSDVVGAKACKTVDLVVPQESWNLDPLNGSGASGYNLDVTKMQMIGMQWTWYGAGFIDFMLRGPEGNYVFAHRFRNSNVNTEAYMRTGNQPVRYEVINEGAKDKLSSAINASTTTLPLSNAYWFPSSGTVLVENELIRFTGNDGLNLTGCVRGTTLTQFVAGSNRTFSAGAATTHAAGVGVILVSNTITPIISHWGSAFMIDGQFDSDRGYIFNYASTGVTANLDKNTAFLMRLAPSVSNAIVGDLGDRELLNRAQLLLAGISVTSDSVSGGGAIVVEGVLNPSNYPTDPTKITWTGLASSAAGGQPSFAQIASGGSVTWSGNASTSTATVQGAFTTTLTARSFAPITNTLTAVSFSSTTQTASAQSFGYLAQAITAISTVTAPYGAYTNATSTVRASKDILITNAAYDALTLVPKVGDSVTGTNIAASTTIVSITRSYLGGTNTQIVLNNFPTVTSTAGNNVTGISISTAYNTTYNSAISNTRNDFLIPDTTFDSITASTPLAVGDGISATTYLVSGQTVSSYARAYIVIAGTSYTRIVMSAVGSATSTAALTNGAQNITITFTSSVAATYNTALNSARSDFLVTQAQYAGGTAKITDVLSVATYLTGSQTISSITPSYTTINGTVYARIVMSGNANASTTAGSGNNSVITATSSATATYGSALSTSRADFLVTDADWAASGIITGDGLSIATYITGSQTINTVTTGYITIGATSYTRIIMSSNANATSTSGGGNDQSITVTAAGSGASYNKTNYLFFTSTSWLASGATIGTKIATSYTSFPAGTAVTALSTRIFGATTVYRATFTQTANASISAGATPTFQFGSQYALPGETVFSFVSNPGNTDTLDLSSLKELTATSIGGRGTFPNGPDVLAINVYKVSGTVTNCNVIIRWGEAQA